jgi:hypothetical protein
MVSLVSSQFSVNLPQSQYLYLKSTADREFGNSFDDIIKFFSALPVLECEGSRLCASWNSSTSN